MLSTQSKTSRQSKSESKPGRGKPQAGSPQPNPLWQQLATRVQPKLAVSAPDDPYEREADRVADQVMRTPQPTVQRSCAACAAGSAACPKCKEEEEERSPVIHRKLRDSESTETSVPDEFLSGMGPGQPLDRAARALMEPRFGRDFSGVRVHADGQAAEAARSISARAFTAGHHLAFAAGEYAPGTRAGNELLAHELTHVVQQSGIGRPPVETGESTSARGHASGSVQRDPAVLARNGTPFIQRQTDTEVPTSSEAAVPASFNNAHDWISAHGVQLVSELTTRIATMPLRLPVEQMHWRGGQEAFARSLFSPLAGDGGVVWALLPPYLQPDSLADAVNIGRDCYPSPFGSPEWQPGVVNEVGRRIALHLVDSLERVGPRAVRHIASNWTAGPATLPLSSTAALSTIPSLGAPAGTSPIFAIGPLSITRGVAFSYPIDPFVYSALRESTDVDVPAYRARYPEEFTAAAAEADQRPLRNVQFRFLVEEGLPRWIRVTDPVDATAEEVANTLYGDPTAANRLTAAPPLFGLPAQDVSFDLLGRRSSDTIFMDQSGRVISPGPRESRPMLLLQHQLALQDAMRQHGVIEPAAPTGEVGPEREILSSPMADEAALRAAARIVPTPGANRELIRERMSLIFNNFVAMEGPAGEFARPPDAPTISIVFHTDTGAITREPFIPPESRDIRSRIAVARERVNTRLAHIASATDAEAVTWDGQTRGQLEIVSAALNGLRIAAGLAAQYGGWPNIHTLIASIAAGYVGAAEISDLYPAARARLDMAEHRSVLFPATAMELWLAQIRQVLAEARTPGTTTVEVNPGVQYDVNDMDRMEQELRGRLAQVRSQLLQDPRAAQATLMAIFTDLQNLQTGASLALNLDTVDRVWQGLYDSLSFMGEVRATWGGGNALLSNAMDSANRLSTEWLQILSVWRNGDRDGARRMLQEKAQGREWRTWVGDMVDLIHEQQQWDRLMTFVAMVGIAVLSGGIGAYVEAGVGAAWGVGAGASAWVEAGAAGVGVLTEATVFTTLSYPITARDPSWGDFGAQLGQNLLFFGGGRILARGFQGLLGEARAATAGGRLATTGVVTAGFVGVNLLMANAQAQSQRGRGLSGGEAAGIGLENVAFVGATALASALLRRPLANLRLEGELAGLNLRHARALQTLDATMREVSLTPSPGEALRLRLIADTQRAVMSEHVLADRMRAIVARADARVEPQRPGGERARDRELARFGIDPALAGQLRSGAIQSQVVAGLQAMQAVRISRALQPVGTDFVISADLYQEALAYFRSLPDTVVGDARAVITDPSMGPRAEPGGESFLVQPSGEAPFRVYRRAPGAVGDVAGRVELAPSTEAAAGARDPIARPALPGGGRAGASEIDWGMPQEGIEGVRRALINQRGDIGAVERSMRDAGVAVPREQLEAVRRYLFDSQGISFDRANYEAWQRLVAGRGQVRDIAFLVHELAEIRALEQIGRQTGFDYRGVDFESMTATERQRWQADFNRYYLQAHSEALAAEYRYVAEAVRNATTGRIRIGPNIAASVDPTRGEARAYMMVDGQPLSQHHDFPAWQARANETVEIGAGAQERLRLPRTTTLAELVAAVKASAGGPEAATARAAIPPGPEAGGSRGFRGRTGAEAGDPRVDPFLDTLNPQRAQRFRDAGHAAALRAAPAVVDFLTRPGERNVSSFEQFITASTLDPAGAIPLLNELLTAHPAMTSAQVSDWATAIRARWALAQSDASPHTAVLRGAVVLSREPRYAANPVSAVADLRALLGDNVELPVAINELTRLSDFGAPETVPVAGEGVRGPDLRFTFAGRPETVGREMYATGLDTPRTATEDDARTQLSDALMREVREKAIDYLRPDVSTFTRRELAVQVRRSSGGYNFDPLLNQSFFDNVMQRVRSSADTIRAGAQDTLNRVVFYDSRGDVVYTWNR